MRYSTLVLLEEMLLNQKSDSYVLHSFIVKCSSVLWLISDYSSAVLYKKEHITTVTSECVG